MNNAQTLASKLKAAKQHEEDLVRDSYRPPARPQADPVDTAKQQTLYVRAQLRNAILAPMEEERKRLAHEYVRKAHDLLDTFYELMGQDLLITRLTKRTPELLSFTWSRFMSLPAPPDHLLPVGYRPEDAGGMVKYIAGGSPEYTVQEKGATVKANLFEEMARRDKSLGGAWPF